MSLLGSEERYVDLEITLSAKVTLQQPQKKILNEPQ